MRALLTFTKYITVGFTNDSDPNQIIENIPTTKFLNSFTVFINIDTGDTEDDDKQMKKIIIEGAKKCKTSKIFILPFAHLSPFAEKDLSIVKKRINNLSNLIHINKKFEVSTVEPNSQNILLTELCMFDGNGSTHLRLTKNSLTKEVEVLAKAFGKENITNILSQI